MVAPNFDATFLRMLAQKGKAYTAGSAAITVVNDFTSPAATGWDDASYRFKFVPQFQNIRKDEEQTTTIEAVDGAEYAFYLSMPVICFGEDPADRALTLMCAFISRGHPRGMLAAYVLLFVPVVNLFLALLGEADLLFQLRGRMMRGVKNGTSGKL